MFKPPPPADASGRGLAQSPVTAHVRPEGGAGSGRGSSDGGGGGGGGDGGGGSGGRAASALLLLTDCLRLDCGVTAGAGDGSFGLYFFTLGANGAAVSEVFTPDHLSRLPPGEPLRVAGLLPEARPAGLPCSGGDSGSSGGALGSGAEVLVGVACLGAGRRRLHKSSSR